MPTACSVSDGWKRLTDVEALEVLLRLNGDVNFIGGSGCTEEGEGEICSLTGFGLHWGRRGVAHGGEEAENNGTGEAFHGW